MPLPAGDPTTVELVDAQLKLNGAEDARLALPVAAANAVVVGLPVAQVLDVETPGAWPANVVLGATLLAARLYLRKNSPRGKERAGGEGAILVAQGDPDIALLLELGPHARPSVG
jgi:hypothetical protein